MIFKFTRREALELDLLICKCGHRPNNHFNWNKKSCAHCECKEYMELPAVGKIVKKVKNVKKTTKGSKAS